MTRIPVPGNEETPLPSSFGGPGFRPRTTSHRDEVSRGTRWRSCGVSCEWGRLGEVVLARPGEELLASEEPGRWLMLEEVDLNQIRKENQAITRLYRREGVVVHRIAPSLLPPPNFLFLRDLFFMTGEGAILARMGSAQRAGEERPAAAALARLGIPLLRTPSGHSLFEGADALWVREDEVWVGISARTNDAGATEVEEVLRRQAVKVTRMRVPKGVQHLLGAVNFLDRGLVAVREEKIGPDIIEGLARLGIEAVGFAEDHEVVVGRALNFVTLGPRRVLMPADCPQVRARLERKGVTCLATPVEEYRKAAGGMACFTGILKRGPPP